MSRITTVTLAALLLAPLVRLGAARDNPAEAFAEYSGWQHSGSFYLLTTPEGADLPASASIDGFPVLVRLHRDFFDFSQAGPKGEDVRFSSGAGGPLPYQIERWDAAKGTACVWVRIPAIQGNSRQEIRVHWGKSDAASESNGKAVFNQSNGYLSVWHMDEPVQDEVGTLVSEDVGTAPAAGVIGQARHFPGSKGIFCGDMIDSYPAGSASHSSEAWFRPEKPNSTVLAWGNEQAQGKVVMQYRSPPHVRMDCYFSGANVEGESTIPMNQWVQVVHTCQKGDSRIYVNGAVDGVRTESASPLSIRRPAKMWIGGWYNRYDFVGDVDEVRISKVVRSTDWVRLQYENQKPMQTLVGPLVQPGDAFSVTPAQVVVPEATTATLKAEAGGAQKIYWILKADGRERVVAVDRLSFTLDAGRVSGDKSLILQFKAVYPDGVKTEDIPIRVLEDVPEPIVMLQAPKQWNGRETIEVVSAVSNLDEMQAKGAGALNYAWDVSGMAAIKEIRPGKLTLKRAMNSGELTVTLTVDNDGPPVSDVITILVNERAGDKWAHREPATDEMPEDNQFYARDDRNLGTLHCNGTLEEAADSVFLKVYRGDTLYQQTNQKLSGDKVYALSAKLEPGLFKYRIEFGSRRGPRETVLHTAGNLVCGDAYLINGQSNAVATDWGEVDFPETCEWIRTFGSMGGNPKTVRWGDAIRRAPGGRLAVGYWGFDLAKHLVESHKIPICIINGAVGGTRIDQHQRNAAEPEGMTTIYGRLLWRVREARLTHDIRGVLWHQGESDQGADGPTGGFGWESYRHYFIELAAGWKQDYPNVQHYYTFQIWPKSCSMGIHGSDNRLREVQRTLPTAFSNLSVMSTLGIQPPGTCHYPPEGYAKMARLICPLVERDNYGQVFDKPIAPPDLQRAYYTSEAKDEILMEFDQPVKWDDALASEFYLDGAEGMVTSGSVSGQVVTLKLNAGSTAKKLTYLDSKSWSQSSLLRGENGIAALTFCEAPILPHRPTR